MLFFILFSFVRFCASEPIHIIAPIGATLLVFVEEIFVLGGFFMFWSLWSYLDCILVLHCVFTFFWLLMYFWYGEIHCYLSFLFHCSLIYIYELFMIYVFVLCFMKSRIYFCFTCIFHTCVYAFVEYFRKYKGWFSRATVYTCNWWIVVRLDYFVMDIIFVKGFYM